MIIKCKMCGGDLTISQGQTIAECEYCGSTQTLPKLNDDRKANLYDRANHFRRQNEYDKAMGIFEQVLQEDRTDAEAYWSLVLCRYGIEYVEDPATGKRIPTMHRVQFTSIMADEDYKSALEYADSQQKAVYMQEAKAIDAIQKGILDISKKEKPFDVFICYKETDEQGKRTPDSVLANDLYHQLTREGFKVFFSRITLEDKLGQEYEPYIFAALNSARVMVVIGTRPEYFRAVWVKNEWSRYLALIKAGQPKTLVPAYKDMDPYDLPEEFSHLQAQDMSKLGFMQDLIHGIKKLAGEEKPDAAQQPIVVQAAAGNGGANAAALLDRAFMALEDGEFAKADDFCEKALNIDARNARAYVGKLMAELKIRRESELAEHSQPIEDSKHYEKALRFGDDALKAKLTEANDAIWARLEKERLMKEYGDAMDALNKARTVTDVQRVKARFETEDESEYTQKVIDACDKKIESINSAAYDRANSLMQQHRYADAAAAFRAIGEYRDCQSAAVKCDELEKQRLADEAAARAEQAKRDAERRAKEEAERKEKERVAAELKAREDEIKRREAEARAAKARKTGVALAIVAVLCVAAFFVVTKVVLPKMKYDNAVKALEAGQYDTAIAAFTELGDYEDSDCRIRQAEANKAFAAGTYDAVGDYYATLPAAYQDHADDFVTMYSDAVALMDGGKYDEAIAAFTKLGNYSDSKTQVSEAAYRKAVSLKDSGDRTNAATVFNGLDDYKDSKNLVAQMAADTQYEAGSYADAWTAYAALPEAYQTHNADYAAMYAAAEALLTAGSYDDAAAAFAVLGSYNGSDDMVKECTYCKAASLAAAGNYDAAITLYEGLNGYSDSNNLSAQAKADKLYAEGKYDAADTAYSVLDESYRTHAADIAALYADAQALLDNGKYDDAITAFTVLGSYNSAADMVKECTYRKAASLADAGDYDAAISLYDGLNDYSDSKSLSTRAKADKLYDAGDYAAAYDVYAALDEAYQTHAADYAAMYAAAETARTSGDYDNAYDQFIALGSYSDAKTKAVQCGTDKADALYAAEKYGEAAEVYTFIGDSDKANESAYKHGQQLAARGEYLQAAHAFWAVNGYSDSQEQHYQMGLQARANGKLADAWAILSEDPEYRDATEAIYQTGVAASAEKLYAVSVPALTQVGAYKDAAMKLTMDTYAWGGQLFDDGEYDHSAEVFASMGDFSDAPTRADEARYAAAGAAMANGSYDDAAARYAAIAGYSDSADKAKAAAYAAADEKLEAGEYADAKARFITLGDYGDSADMAKECDYRPAKALYDAAQYHDALTAFNDNGLAGYKDANTLMADCRYNIGREQMSKGAYDAAVTWFDAAGDYSDAKAQAAECRRQIALAKAAALEEAGDYEAAYTQYEQAGAADKMQETAYQAALARTAQSNYKDAIAWYEKADTYSDSKEQILSIGEYYYATQQYDLAKEVYAKVSSTGNAAQRLYELGQYYELVGNNEHAAQAYHEAGDYQDAQEKATEMDYQTACSQMLAGDYEGAKLTLAKIPGYKDADSKVTECENAIAAAAAAAAREAYLAPFKRVGNYVTYGHYEQDNNTSNGKEAIEWLVLDYNSQTNRALLISRYGLDAHYYHPNTPYPTWEKSDIRAWLNKDFLNAAFTAEEQSAIVTTKISTPSYKGNSGGNSTQDRVWLLSRDEATKYFKNDEARKATPTKYAVAQGAFQSNSYKLNGTGCCWWWLRSPGSISSRASYVSSDGSLIYDYDVSYASGVIRPAFWLDLGSVIP